MPDALVDTFRFSMVQPHLNMIDANIGLDYIIKGLQIEHCCVCVRWLLAGHDLFLDAVSFGSLDWADSRGCCCDSLLHIAVAVAIVRWMGNDGAVQLPCGASRWLLAKYAKVGVCRKT